jgi:hypothetical protein
MRDKTSAKSCDGDSLVKFGAAKCVSDEEREFGLRREGIWDR